MFYGVFGFSVVSGCSHSCLGVFCSFSDFLPTRCVCGCVCVRVRVFVFAGARACVWFWAAVYASMCVCVRESAYVRMGVYGRVRICRRNGMSVFRCMCMVMSLCMCVCVFLCMRMRMRVWGCMRGYVCNSWQHLGHWQR
jgi:hypothetical protein